MKQASIHIPGLWFALISKGNREQNDNIKKRDKRLKLVKRESKLKHLRNLVYHTTFQMFSNNSRLFKNYFNNSLHASMPSGTKLLNSLIPQFFQILLSQVKMLFYFAGFLLICKIFPCSVPVWAEGCSRRSGWNALWDL